MEKRKGKMSAVVQKEHVRALKSIVGHFMARAECDGCIICDGGGHVLLQSGAGISNPLLLAALGAGVFGGSRELAQMLGEEDFSVVFHQGEHKSIFIRAVNSEILLVVTFSKQDSAGLVKLYSGPAAERIDAMFETIEEDGEQVHHEEKTFVLKTDEAVFKAV